MCVYLYKYIYIYIYIYVNIYGIFIMKKQTTYLKMYFISTYVFINPFFFYNKNCYKNTILQSISDNYRGKLVNKN